MGKEPFFLSAALAAAAHAGIVLENTSSRPLARTRVHLRVLENGATLQLASALTDSSGQYWFPSLRDGLYLIVAARRGYAEAPYGQQRAKGSGTLIPVQPSSNTFAEIRMRRLEAIIGGLVDENEVALPDVEVLAYRAQQPIRIAARTKSDDRGIYRLSGLARVTGCPPGGKQHPPHPRFHHWRNHHRRSMLLRRIQLRKARSWQV